MFQVLAFCQSNWWLVNGSDERLILETSAFKLFTVANLHFQLIVDNT